MANRKDERMQMAFQFDVPVNADASTCDIGSNVVCFSTAKEKVALMAPRCDVMSTSITEARTDEQIIGDILHRASRLSW